MPGLFICVRPAGRSVLLAEMRLAPKVNREALSTILISRYDRHQRTARAPRATRQHRKLEGE